MFRSAAAQKPLLSKKSKDNLECRNRKDVTSWYDISETEEQFKYDQRKKYSPSLKKKNTSEKASPHVLIKTIEQVKYSPPIEAGASFNPPNLAKDCILRASVSEAMGFL